MKRFFVILALAAVALGASAQNSVLRQRMEIAEFESEENNTSISVFYMDDETPRVYYLSLGNLGIGTDIVQVQFDPFYELFIPLGNTLDDAIEKMKDIQDLYKLPRLSSSELDGCFAVAYPDGTSTKVAVTARRFLASKVLEFSLPGDGPVRATHITKGNFSSLLSTLKLYRKIHPNEK